MMRAVNIRKYVKTVLATNKSLSHREPHWKGNFDMSRVNEFTEESEASNKSTFMANQNLSNSHKLNHKQQDVEGFNKTRPRHIFENHIIQSHETEKHIDEMKEIIKLQYQEHEEVKRRLEILENATKNYHH